MKNFDGVLFVTPEYNRSVLRCSRMHWMLVPGHMGKVYGMGKPGAVVSVSPGGISGFGANHHLRQSLVFLNVPTLQQPRPILVM